MKTYTIEQVVMAVAPAPTPNVAFTNRVMQQVLQQEARKAPAKQQKPLFTLFWHMPKLAVGLLIIIIAIAVSGTVYAVFTALWQKPVVHTRPPQENQFGRHEVIADFESCANKSGQVRYEVKKGATINPAEVPKILQARCERDIIRAALPNSFSGPGNRASGMPDGTIYPRSSLTTAAKVTTINEDRLELVGDINLPQNSYKPDADTKYIVNGIEATHADITPGDTVLLHQTIQIKHIIVRQDANGTSARGEQVGEAKVNYVIKMDLPMEYYNPAMQNQIAERKTCLGNPEDTCIESAAIVLYDGVMPPLIDGLDDSNEIRELQGVIQSYTARTITIKTSSGKLVTVSTPRDVIAEFNRSRSANYDGLVVKLGHTLDIRYFTNDKAKPTVDIPTDKVMAIVVNLDLVNKNDPLQPY